MGPYSLAMEVIRRGDEGQAVRDVQARLTALGHQMDRSEVQEDRFDASTDAAVRAFQHERGLLVDGLVGSQTWQELVEAGYRPGDRVLYLRRPPFRGEDVRVLQARLNTLGFDPGREDAILGEATDTAVREFQRNVGLSPDGIVGSTTLAALERLRDSVRGPGRALVREAESLRSPQSLEGRTIAIDAAHGPADPGAVGPRGTRESEVTFALAERLATTLAQRGAKPLPVRGVGEHLALEERIERVNASGADALISLHLAIDDDPQAAGALVYYFGRLGTISIGGQTLADAIVQRMHAHLALRPITSAPKAFPMLRETQMPAVVILPCHVTNPEEERMLSAAPFHDGLASAVLEALEEYFEGGGREDP